MIFGTYLLWSCVRETCNVTSYSTLVKPGDKIALLVTSCESWFKLPDYDASGSSRTMNQDHLGTQDCLYQDFMNLKNNLFIDLLNILVIGNP